MKLEVPLYEGDSIIRHGPTTSPGAVAGPRQQPHSTPRILQRTMEPIRTPVTALDVAEVEARARALRAAVIADLMRRGWKWLSAFYDRALQRREEEYLARSRSRAELRKLERRGHPLHI